MDVFDKKKINCDTKVCIRWKFYFVTDIWYGDKKKNNDYGGGRN